MKRILARQEHTTTDSAPPLDPKIERAVLILRGAGIETYESCQGGPRHAYPEPTIRFHGEYSDGFMALAIVMKKGLAVAELRRIWVITHHEPVGPHWELTFVPD